MTRRRLGSVIVLGSLVAVGFVFLASFRAISSDVPGQDRVAGLHVPTDETGFETDVAPGTTSSTAPDPRWKHVIEPSVSPGERSVRVPVLMYHYIRPLDDERSKTGNILSVTPEHFASQMQEIVDLGYHPISPQDLYDTLMSSSALPAKPVIITFDDGYLDQYTDAWPVLQRLNFKATFFIITGYTKGEYLDHDKLLELDRSGLATVAAHTRHHAALGRSSDQARQDEILGSKQDLEALLGHPVTIMAYPYGSYDEEVKKLVAKNGFQMAFATTLGSLHAPSSLLELRRVRVLDGEKLGPILERFSQK